MPPAKGGKEVNMNKKELKSLLKLTGTSKNVLTEVVSSWEEFWNKHREKYPWIQGRTAEQWTKDAMITSALCANRIDDWEYLMEDYWMDIGYQCGYTDNMRAFLNYDDFARYCYLCGVRDALN